MIAMKASRRGPTTGTWLAGWLDRQVLLRPSTRLAYRIHVDRHLTTAIGSIPLAAVTAADVERLVARLADQGLSGGSIQRIVSTLRAALTAAVRDGHLPANPVSGVRLPTVVPVRPSPWGAHHARQLLRDTDGVMAILVRLAISTGMRRGELLALRWDDVDLHAGCLHVRAARIQVGATVVAGPPKSQAGQRTIWLDTATTDVLAQWKQASPDASGLVLVDADGQPLIPWEATRAFDRLIRRLGLPRIRLHDLRHLSARLGIATGEPLPAVRDRLGHSDITTTVGYYGRTVPSVARAAARRLADLIDPDAA